jgi:hypothetical protein
MAQHTVKNSESPHDVLAAQKAKNEAAISLLEEWLADESGYDEKTWPIVQKVVEENRLSDRKRFNG